VVSGHACPQPRATGQGGSEAGPPSLWWSQCGVSTTSLRLRPTLPFGIESQVTADGCLVSEPFVIDSKWDWKAFVAPKAASDTGGSW